MYAARSAAPGSTSPNEAVLGAVHADVDHRRAGLRPCRRRSRAAARRRRRGCRRRACAAGGRRCASGRSSRSRSPGAGGAPSACRRCSSARRRRRARPRSRCAYSASMRMIPSGVAGHEVRPAEVEPARVDGMEAVDVLPGVERLDRPGLVDVRRAAAAGRGSRRRRRRRSARRGAARSSSSGDVGGQAEVVRVDADARRRLVLAVDVDVRRGVVADEHGRQADVAELARPPRRPPRASWPRAPCRRSAGRASA